MSKNDITINRRKVLLTGTALSGAVVGSTVAGSARSDEETTESAEYDDEEAELIEEEWRKILEEEDDDDPMIIQDADEIQSDLDGIPSDDVDAMEAYYEQLAENQFEDYDGAPDGTYIYEGEFQNAVDPADQVRPQSFDTLHHTWQIASVPDPVPSYGGTSIEVGYEIEADAFPNPTGEANIIIVIGGTQETIVGVGLGDLDNNEDSYCLGGSPPKVPGSLTGCIHGSLDDGGIEFGASIDLQIPESNPCSPVTNCQIDESIGFECTIDEIGGELYDTCSTDF